MSTPSTITWLHYALRPVEDVPDVWELHIEPKERLDSMISVEKRAVNSGGAL